MLRRAVLERGRVDGPILRVDDFLNHRVEPRLMTAIGADLAARFQAAAPELVLTAEASGIPPALAAAQVLDVPMVYAKKFVGRGNPEVFARDVPSTTKGTEYRVEVSRRALRPGLRVLIVDDFLSGGRTAVALGEITEESGATVAGLGFVIEKRFAGGRDRLAPHGWAIDALVTVASLDGGRIALLEPPG
jgi:xanthine phosphoribosyltransferase